MSLCAGRGYTLWSGTGRERVRFGKWQGRSVKGRRVIVLTRPKLGRTRLRCCQMAQGGGRGRLRDLVGFGECCRHPVGVGVNIAVPLQW